MSLVQFTNTTILKTHQQELIVQFQTQFTSDINS